MTWGLVWFVLAFKLPLVALLAVLLWAFRQAPEEGAGEDDGGSRHADPLPDPHPRRPFPSRPRRGPHGDPAPAAPARVRSAPARARAKGR